MTTVEDLKLRPDPGERFASDEHRHIAGHLAQPRTLYLLARELMTDDTVNMAESGIVAILAELEEDGLVVRFSGPYDDAQALVDEIQGDSQTITLPDEQAEAYIARAHKTPLRQQMYLGGEEWVLSQSGMDLLNAGLPEEEEE